MSSNESERLEEVQRFLQIDFDENREFKDITGLASELCQMPISLITLLDKDVNWIKAASGVNEKMAPRETSFCQYSIQQSDLLVIPDATKDSRFDNNPLVHIAPGLRFYAGAPLVLNNGYRIGALCVFDLKPNNLTDIQKRALTVLSKHVTSLMELKLGQKQLLSHVKEIELKNESLRAIAQMQSHDIRQPLASIIGLVNLIKKGHHTVDEEWLKMISDATDRLDNKIRSIVNETLGNKDMKLLRYNKMVEEIEDYAIILLDQDGNVENWNLGAQKIKGYRAEEIIGKHFSIFYSKKDIEKGLPYDLLNEARVYGVARSEGERMKKDGTQFWGRVVITAIHDEEKQIIGFTKVTRHMKEMDRIPSDRGIGKGVEL